VRRAGPADAAAIRALTRDVYAKWIPSIGREPKPMAADYDKAVRAHWIDLLEDGGALLALIETVPMDDHLWIENIAVSESRQGRGLGRSLLAHAESLARQAGLPAIRLNTNAAFSANLAFYLRTGFAEDRRERLPDGGTAVYFAKPVE
jgi:GNAT superfamily N-acetyltransferase